MNSVKSNSICYFFILLFLVSCNQSKDGDYISFEGINAGSEHARFVGNKTCVNCHKAEYNDWKNSHHAKAMMVANSKSVVGDFNNKELRRNGQTHRMYKKGNAFFVSTDGEDGKMKEYQIKYTFGFTPIQQYLVSIGKGKLQTLALTWDDIKKEWFYMSDEVYKGQSVNHENWLHWTNQSQNWNGMCAECHSTNLKKNYDFKKDVYKTTWSEINVSCEACHGPASKHLEWTKDKEEEVANLGFVKNLNPKSNAAFVDNCARCHSRRSVFEDFHYSGESIYDQMIPSTVASPNYHDDGQIKEEDYIYGSFLQSKMYQKGIKCNDCHNVHSAKKKFEGNKLCLQCHQTSKYNTESHHHHKNESKGALCVNCHMPGQFYMGRDFRRDHSFRVPRPDVSKAIGSPNACNQCHTDQSVDWAVSKTSAWYGKPKNSHYGVVFHQSSQMGIEGLQGLKKIIFDNKTAMIVRITAIDLLQRNYPDQSQAILNSLLNHKNPALRFQSVYNSNVEPENANQFLVLLKDSVKAIRSDAAMKLSRNPSYVSEEYKKDYDRSLKEYLSIINYNIDFPDAKLTMADYYHSVKEYKKAEEFYKKAIKQDNQLFTAQINLAYLYNATNRIPEAILVFDNYLKKNPNDFQVFQAVGLLLGESGDYKKAAVYLEKAKSGIAQNERIVLNLAKIYAYTGEKEKAERYFVSLVSQYPSNSEYYMALFEFYTQQKNYPKAKNIALLLLQKFPQIPERKQIEYYISTGS